MSRVRYTALAHSSGLGGLSYSSGVDRSSSRSGQIEQEVEELRTKLRLELSAQSELKNEIKTLQRQLLSRQSDLDGKDRELAQQAVALQKLKQQFNKVQIDFDLLERERQSLTTENRLLKSEITSAVATKKDLESERLELKAKVATAEGSVRSVESEQTQLQAEVAQLRKELQAQIEKSVSAAHQADELNDKLIRVSREASLAQEAYERYFTKPRESNANDEADPEPTQPKSVRVDPRVEIELGRVKSELAELEEENDQLRSEVKRLEFDLRHATSLNFRSSDDMRRRFRETERQLKQRAEAFEMEAHTLTLEKRQLQQQLRDAQRGIDAANRDTNRCKDETQIVREQLQRSQESVRREAENRRKLQEQVLTLQHHIEDLEKEKERLLQDLSTPAEPVEGQDAEAAQRDRADRLAKELAQAQEQLHALQRDEATKAREVANLRADSKQYQNQLRDLEVQLESAQDSLKKDAQTRKRLDEDIKQLSKQLQTIQDEKAALQKEVESRRVEVEARQREIARITEDNQRLQSEVIHLKRHSDTIQRATSHAAVSVQQQERLHDELKQARDEKRTLQDAINKFHNEQRHWEQEKHRLEALIDQAKAETNEQVKKLHAAQEESKKLKESLSDAQNESKRLKEQLVESKAESKHLKEALGGETQKLHDDAKATQERLAAEAQTLKTQLATSQVESKKLSESLAVAHEESKKLKESLSSTQDENKKLKESSVHGQSQADSQNAKLIKELSEASQQLKSAHDENKKQQVEIANLKRDLANLHKEVDSHKSAASAAEAKAATANAAAASVIAAPPAPATPAPVDTSALDAAVKEVEELKAKVAELETQINRETKAKEESMLLLKRLQKSKSLTSANTAGAAAEASSAPSTPHSSTPPEVENLRKELAELSLQKARVEALESENAELKKAATEWRGKFQLVRTLSTSDHAKRASPLKRDRSADSLLVTTKSSSKSPPLLSFDAHTAKVIKIQSIARGFLARLDYKEARYRRSVAQEMLDTERAYVTTLGVVARTFVNPLRHMVSINEPIISPDDIQSVFGNVDLIWEGNKKLLAQLEARLSKWHAGQLIGDVFRQAVKEDWLKPHVPFIQNFKQSAEARARLINSSPQFALFLKLTRAMPGVDGKSLDDLLINPVQRLPRYKLLLSDLLRKTSMTHPDHLALTRAVAEIDDFTAFVNENNRRADELNNLSQRLAGLDLLEVVEDRRLLFEGKLSIIQGKEAKRRYVFLFSDCLVIAKTAAKKRLSLTKEVNNAQFKVAASIKLTPKTIVENIPVFDGKPTNLMFGVTFGEGQQNQLVASSEEEKTKWMDTIVAAIPRPMVKKSRSKKLPVKPTRQSH